MGNTLRQADANLELIREPCLADGRSRDLLDRLSAEGGEAPDDEVKLELYQTTNDIHAVAGVFGLAEMSAAAFCLCELVDRLRTQAAWSKVAVASPRNRRCAWEPDERRRYAPASSRSSDCLTDKIARTAAGSPLPARHQSPLGQFRI